MKLMNEIMDQIGKVDKENDKMVYELYACPDWSLAEFGRLTEEEIQIVEQSTH
jgi:hypothetical protein